MLSSILMIFIGLVLLSLSYKTHYKQMTNNYLSSVFKYIHFFSAIILLSLSVYLSINAVGVSIGLSTFFFALTPFIVLIALLLTYKEKLVLPLALIAVLVTFISFIF